jgi:hypothetical protein
LKNCCRSFSEDANQYPWADYNAINSLKVGFVVGTCSIDAEVDCFSFDISLSFSSSFSLIYFAFLAFLRAYLSAFFYCFFIYSSSEKSPKLELA